ncbi:MAG: hypothetical protein KAJ62_09375 [Desulfobacteraceae bacterium]|nr:hypothetical protein [Desulfobacteraceae bacterium]
MKLTDPDIIKEGEKDLIDAIKDDLDLDSINEIIKDKLKVKNLESKGGKIIVHNNEIAFQIEFELSLNGSLMFDREGNYIPDDKDIGLIEEPEPPKDEDKAEDTGKEEEIEEIENEVESEAEAAEEKDDEDVESDDDVENIASELITGDDLVADDLSNDSESDELSEIDLDIEGFEDEDDDDDIDFSDDEDIDDILKESREFWENKKSE